MYNKVIENITHWHEHEIHEKITPLIGYNSWKIGRAYYDSENQMNLLLMFNCREDYEKCVAAIVDICSRDEPLD